MERRVGGGARDWGAVITAWKETVATFHAETFSNQEPREGRSGASARQTSETTRKEREDWSVAELRGWGSKECWMVQGSLSRKAIRLITFLGGKGVIRLEEAGRGWDVRFLAKKKSKPPWNSCGSTKNSGEAVKERTQNLTRQRARNRGEAVTRVPPSGQGLT